MRRAIAERRVVPLERARQAVASFTALPKSEIKLSEFTERPHRASSHEGPSYSFHVDRDLGWEVRVRGFDGRVTSLRRELVHPPVDAETYAIPRPEAAAIAEAFARTHIPNFRKRRWHFHVEKGQYERIYRWRELLGRRRVRAPAAYEVRVDHYTGQVTEYEEPSLPPLMTLVPQLRVSRAKALALAAAPYDTRELPLSPPYLESLVFTDGSSSLWWQFEQRFPDPEEIPSPEDYEPWVRVISVNALDGEVTLDGPLGFPLEWEEFRRKPKLTPPDPARIKVRNAKERLTYYGTSGTVHRGRVWVTADSLRLFGVEVQASRTSVRMRKGTAQLRGRAIGAELQTRRDYAWWVPLRKVASRFGWGLRWNPKAREVLLDGLPDPDALR